MTVQCITCENFRRKLHNNKGKCKAFNKKITDCFEIHDCEKYIKTNVDELDRLKLTIQIFFVWLFSGLVFTFFNYTMLFDNILENKSLSVAILIAFNGLFPALSIKNK